MFCFHASLSGLKTILSISWKCQTAHKACNVSCAKGKDPVPACEDRTPNMLPSSHRHKGIALLDEYRLPALTRARSTPRLKRPSQSHPTQLLPRTQIKTQFPISPLTAQQTALITAPLKRSTGGKRDSKTSTPSPTTSIPNLMLHSRNCAQALPHYP
jgi:hypothetical protein